jgi:hypothetical protein
VGTDIAKPEQMDRVMDWLVSNTLVTQCAGKECDKATKNKLLKDMKAYAADLAGPNPTPLERTLADVATTSWFALRTYEHVDASAGSRSIHQAEYSQSKIDRAHRRLMMTLKTLATVRKLALPAIQVNLANQQVNVAGKT